MIFDIMQLIRMTAIHDNARDTSHVGFCIRHDMLMFQIYSAILIISHLSLNLFIISLLDSFQQMLYIVQE